MQDMTGLTDVTVRERKAGLTLWGKHRKKNVKRRVKRASFVPHWQFISRPFPISMQQRGGFTLAMAWGELRVIRRMHFISFPPWDWSKQTCGHLLNLSEPSSCSAHCPAALWTGFYITGGVQPRALH